MISAQTRSAFVARENRCTLTRIMRQVGPLTLQNNFAGHVGAAKTCSSSLRAPVRPGPLDQSRNEKMRFMMLMIPRGYENAAPGTMPPAEAVAAMMKYNEALKEAGVLITLDGLHPPSMGARVSFEGGKPVVTDGPFAESKEVLGGYWMIDVASKDEAIAWAKRCPASNNEIIEIRQVQEMSDFPADVQKAAAGFTELQRGTAARLA
jgi:hypothetical protein